MEQPVAPGGEPRAPAQAPGAGLRRSASNRLIGGVCGGLAEYTGIDPVVFRVTIAVLALVGGAGLLFYGAAMLLVPDARTGRAPVDRVLHPRQHPRVRVAALLLAIVVGIIIAGGLGGAFGSGSLAIVIVAAIAAIAAHRRGADLRGRMSGLVRHGTAPPHAGPAPGVTTPPPPQSPPWTRQEAPTSQYVDLSTLPRPGYAGNGPGSATPERRRPRSITWYVLLAAALAAVAVVLAQQHLGLLGDARLPLTAALTVLGLGLLLSTWVGRARVSGWGVLLAIALAAMTLLHGIGGGQYLRDVAWRPATAAQLSAQQPYQGDLANARLDLTALPVTDHHTYDVNAQIDAGRLVVTVPRGTRVHVHARCDACRMNVFGQQYAGTDNIRVDRTFPAIPNRGETESEQGDGRPRGAGASVHRPTRPVFDLNLRGDAALLEVRRAA